MIEQVDQYLQCHPIVFCLLLLLLWAIFLWKLYLKRHRYLLYLTGKVYFYDKDGPDSDEYGRNPNYVGVSIQRQEYYLIGAKGFCREDCLDFELEELSWNQNRKLQPFTAEGKPVSVEGEELEYYYHKDPVVLKDFKCLQMQAEKDLNE